MPRTEKSLEAIPTSRLYRAEQILDNQRAALTLEDSLDKKIPKSPSTKKGETGGPKGLDPTRYGDWERNGRCIDF